jgi:hypothetical protein
MQDTFESSDVENVVGISRNYLNKFIERELYGIVPSERMDVGRGRRRWFSRDDVFGIALVWWLFEAGLRSDVIKRILRDCFGQKDANANKAAYSLREDGVAFLVICRIPRSGGGHRRKNPQQSVHMLDKDDLLALVGENKAQAIQIIPAGELFWNLEMAIAELE